PVTTSAAAPELHVSEPRIYYGQIEHSYVFADTEQPEFDYPSTGGATAGGDSQDHTVRYQGRGGIPIGNSALARWAFSLRLGDAYDGTINLYVSDPHDPIARTYSRIFPGLLQPIERMPSGLRAHIRYPEDLFWLQRAVYAAYHVDDPRIFYFREDSWAIPTE